MIICIDTTCYILVYYYSWWNDVHAHARSGSCARCAMTPYMHTHMRTYTAKPACAHLLSVVHEISTSRVVPWRLGSSKVWERQSVIWLFMMEDTWEIRIPLQIVDSFSWRIESVYCELLTTEAHGELNTVHERECLLLYSAIPGASREVRSSVEQTFNSNPSDLRRICSASCFRYTICYTRAPSRYPSDRA